jgi:hypothetical protein
MGTSSRFSSRKLSPSSSAAKLPATKDTNLATCSAQHGSTLVLGPRIELSKHSRSVVMCVYAWACAGAGRRLTIETCCHVTAVAVTCSQPTQLKRNRHMDTAQSAVHMLGRMYARAGDTQWKLLCIQAQQPCLVAIQHSPNSTGTWLQRSQVCICLAACTQGRARTLRQHQRRFGATTERTARQYSLTSLQQQQTRQGDLMRGVSACRRHVDAARAALRRSVAALPPPHFRLTYSACSHA